MAPPVPDRRDDRGMATAEYAVGTAGAVCIACVLIQLAQHDPSWITDVVERLADVGRWIGLAADPRPGLM